MENNQPPRWWINCVKQFKLKTATRTRDQRGCAPRDYSRARQPIDLRYADASGGGKRYPAKCAAVVLCCRLLSLVDRRAGRAGQRMQCWSSGLFPHPISGIVMSNQNAVRYLGTLQPPHHSVRLALISSLHGITLYYRNIESRLLIMPFVFQQWRFKSGLVFD